MAPTKETTDTEEQQITMVLIKEIEIDEHHKRKQSANDFDAGCADLAAKMQAEGQLVPAKVADAEGGGYRLVFGLRRLTARVMNGDDAIEAILGGPMTDEQIEAERLSENLNRKDASPIDEMIVLGKLYDAVESAMEMDGYQEVLGDTLAWHEAVVQRVADTIGKTAKWVRDRLYLRRLCPKVAELVVDGHLPLAHARQIAKLGSDKVQLELAREACLAEDGTGGMDIDLLTYAVQKRLTKLDGVPWRLDVAFAGKPTCDGCEHNTGTDAQLFEGSDAPEKAHCLDVSCFHAKSRAANGTITKAIGKISTRLKGKKLPDIKLGTLREAGLIPEAIKPNTLAARVRAKLSPRSGPANNGPSATSGTTADGKDRVERQVGLEAQADMAWRKHITARMKEEEEAIATELKKSPEKLFVLFAISVADTGAGYQTAKTKKAKASLLERSMRLFDVPEEELTLEDLRALAQLFLSVYAENRNGYFDIYASTEEAVDKASEVLLGPASNENVWKKQWIAEHQPKPAAKKAAKKKVAKKTARKKAAKKVAKKKAAKGRRA